MEASLSSKGQLVIPRKIRNSHGWGPGMVFSVIDADDSIILRPVAVNKNSNLEDVIGCAGYKGEKKSLAQMDAGILEEAKKRVGAW